MPPRTARQPSQQPRSMQTAGQKNQQGNMDWWDAIENDNINQSEFKQLAKPTLQRGAVLKNQAQGKTKQAYQTKVELTAQSDETPLISLDVKSYLIWTIGTSLISLIIFICELVQNSGWEAAIRNPLQGPSAFTLQIMGAKYGPPIIGGDFWRYVTAIFLSSGIIQLIISWIFAAVTFRVEYESGYWRAVLTFLGAGSYGYILSTLFIPNIVSCGSTDAYMGYVSLLLVDLFQTWRSVNRRIIWLAVYIACIVIAFVIGLSPFMDNFANFGGLLMGVLISLMLVPNYSYSDSQRFWRGILSFLAYPITSFIYCVCMVIVFRVINPDISWCKWCQIANCVNISGWCPPITTYSHATHYVNQSRYTI